MIFDILLAAFLLAMAFWGFKSGLVRSVFSLGGFALSILLAAILYPMVTNWLMKTQFYTFILERVVTPNMPAADAGWNLPSFLTEGINSSVQTAAESAAQSIVAIAAVLVVFVLCKVGLSLVAKVLNLVAKLPVISLFNKLGGLMCGAINGLLVLYIVFAILTLFINNDLLELINQSRLATEFYNNNLLMKLIFHS